MGNAMYVNCIVVVIYHDKKKKKKKRLQKFLHLVSHH